MGMRIKMKKIPKLSNKNSKNSKNSIKIHTKICKISCSSSGKTLTIGEMMNFKIYSIIIWLLITFNIISVIVINDSSPMTYIAIGFIFGLWVAEAVEIYIKWRWN